MVLVGIFGEFRLLNGDLSSPSSVACGATFPLKGEGYCKIPFALHNKGRENT